MMFRQQQWIVTESLPKTPLCRVINSYCNVHGAIVFWTTIGSPVFQHTLQLTSIGRRQNSSDRVYHNRHRPTHGEQQTPHTSSGGGSGGTGLSELSFCQCGQCGSTHIKGRCHARGKTCRKCGKKNHFRKVCRSVREVPEVSEQEFSIDAAKVYFDKSKPWVVKLKIRETIVPLKINSDADIPIMSDRTFRQLMNKPKLKEFRISLTSPGGKLAVAGEFDAVTEVKKQSLQVQGGCDEKLLVYQPAMQEGSSHDGASVTCHQRHR
ncbi:retrovirus-related pol polyprotein from [Plakobranchus ocellatus]|uniref:Retrovirus-related pol polyprotein from n=1 Tax=Plakobranchus ocellatus TaxID=259542 RepID=A0AAV4C6C8_9GAST|nr:retrovirus-related pol polyprotein from [Plakobranchus ocellatus]